MDTGLLSAFVASFVTLFIVIDPVMVSPLFAALTHNEDDKGRRRIAIQAAVISAAIMTLFGLAGIPILHHLGIDLAAFRAAGGILLFLIGFRMFFDPDEELEAKRPGPKASSRENIAFFPIAMPMLAGPGGIATIMLLMSPDASITGTDRLMLQGVTLLAMYIVLLLGIFFMMFSGKIAGALGRTGMNAVSRLLGMILMALAVQYVFDGIRVGILERVAETMGA